MSEFIKSGKRIRTKPNGLDYDLIDGKVYNLKYDRFECEEYLEEDGGLNLPSKVYNTTEDTNFISRVTKFFNSTDKNTTGVLLSGIKGTGKTILAKLIAKEINLPIIVVDSNFPINHINDFFREFNTPVTVILDEIDKSEYNTESLLTWLDGVQTTAKKLVLFTCNDQSKLNDCLFDRCSRIRYYRKFKPEENERFLDEILKDKGFDEAKCKEMHKFIMKNIKLLSIDNVLSFIEEVLLFPEDSYDDILKNMNITKK